MSFGGGDTVATAKVVIDADTKGMTSGLRSAEGQVKSFAGSAQTHSSKAKSAFAGIGRAAKLAGGVGGLLALGAGAKAAFSDFIDGQKGMAQTEAALKSTGGAANVTAKQISGLADAISMKSGMDDDAVQSGENMLLTFTNIRNEAGKGNDIFNQTTGIMADMSVALGQDTASSAMQLGKALNDPIKGVTALQRVGVAFTEGQKKQIKSMVDNGNTMGAQKLILHELNKEFGGSAKAMGKTLPGQIGILKNSILNLTNEGFAAALPYIERFISFVREHMPEIKQAIRDGIQAAKPFILGLIDTLKDIGSIVMSVVGIIRRNWSTIGPIVRQAAQNIRNVAKIIQDVVKLVAAIFRGDWRQAWAIFKQLVAHAWTLVKGIVRSSMLIIKALIRAGWAAIKAVTAAAWAGIKALLQAAWNGIKAGASAAWSALKSGVASAWSSIKGKIAELANSAKERAVTAFNTMKERILAALRALPGAVAGIAADIGRAIYNGVLSGLGDIGGAIKDKITSGLGGLNPFASGTNFAPGGLSLVGEAGPEVMYVPPGAKIAPASQTNNLLRRMGGGGGGGTNIHITVKTLHPGDPTTLRQIGDVVNRSVGMVSGNRMYSPNFTVGI